MVTRANAQHSDRNVRHAQNTLNTLIARVGSEAVLEALGTRRFAFHDFPEGKEGEHIMMLNAGRIEVTAVNRGELGLYTCVGREPGVVAVPIFTDMYGMTHVVLTEQIRGGVGKLFTELPAGGQRMKDGIPQETLIKTAIRETLEETGYRGIEETAEIVQKEQGYTAPGFTSDRQVVVQFEVEHIPVARSASSSDSKQITGVFSIPLDEAARIYSNGGSPGKGEIDVKTKAEVLAAAIRFRSFTDLLRKENRRE